MILALLLALLQDELKPEKAESIFIDAYLAYTDGDREESTKLFTKIYTKFPTEPIGAISAYNIACNFALEGESEKGLEWLKKALDAGYDNFEHVESDGDLAGVREESKYEGIMAAAKKKAGDDKRATIKEDQAKTFAEKLAAAHKDGETNTRQALFSRLGWFAHAKTIEWLNAELKKKGLKLEGSGSNIAIVDATE